MTVAQDQPSPVDPSAFTYVSLDGKCRTHIDFDHFDFSIEAAPDHNKGDLCAMITQAQWWGFELLDEDECPAELLADGWTRIYMTPVVPVDDMAYQSILDDVAWKALVL